jgi:hypothetical protein
MRASLAGLVLGLVLSASPAAAQVEPCLADPIQCVGEAVTDVDETAEETVGDAADTVDETVDGVVGTVDDVVEPDPDGGSSDPSPSGGAGGDAPGRRNDRGAGEGPAGTGARTPDGGGAVAAAPPATRRAREAGRSALPGGRIEQETAIERLRQALSQGGEAFVFPLTLLLLVGGFLLVQSRIDRSDPKLALAPVDGRDDVLPFQ